MKQSDANVCDIFAILANCLSGSYRWLPVKQFAAKVDKLAWFGSQAFSVASISAYHASSELRVFLETSRV